MVGWVYIPYFQVAYKKTRDVSECAMHTRSTFYVLYFMEWVVLSSLYWWRNWSSERSMICTKFQHYVSEEDRSDLKTLDFKPPASLEWLHKKEYFRVTYWMEDIVFYNTL